MNNDWRIEQGIELIIIQFDYNKRHELVNELLNELLIVDVRRMSCLYDFDSLQEDPGLEDLDSKILEAKLRCGLYGRSKRPSVGKCPCHLGYTVYKCFLHTEELTFTGSYYIC